MKVPPLARRVSRALAAAALALSVAACSARLPAPEKASSPAPGPAPSSSAALTADPPVRMPHPARAGHEAAALANAECERCHEPEAREWRGSLHQRANIEPAYRRSFAREPFAFCRGCHAPEADPESEETAAESALGVGCVTCHQPAGEAVLAAPTPRDDRPAPHPLAREARFASPAACAGCHEFAFPDSAGSPHPELMQSTLREHASSAGAATPCAGCHMPAGPGGRRGHSFVASRDPAVVRGAATIEARREGPERIRVVITPRTPGHAFPTGDLFRRLEISAEVVGPDEMVLGSASRYLTRHFAPRRGQGGRRLVSDDRPRDAPVTLDLEVGPSGRDHEIAWRVAYQRVAHPRGVDEEDAEIEGEIVLASGRFKP